jgi:hypothetical protein
VGTAGKNNPVTEGHGSSTPLKDQKWGGKAHRCAPARFLLDAIRAEEFSGESSETWSCPRKGRFKKYKGGGESHLVLSFLLSSLLHPVFRS